jgi:RimJ/RimL family protein N-acetyltransferase
VICGTHESADGKRVADWFGEVVGKPQNGPYAAMGWEDGNGRLRTVALFNDYNGANVEMHMVGSLSRGSIRDALRYAFLQLKVLRITGKPYRSNVKLREILVRLGFKAEGTMQRYYGSSSDDDAIIYRLDRDAAAKWMT